MKKNKLFIILILSVATTPLLALASWTEPPQNPPLGNVAAPINTSMDVQTKAGVFKAGGIRSLLDLYVDGLVGIGTLIPSAKLDVLANFGGLTGTALKVAGTNTAGAAYNLAQFFHEATPVATITGAGKITANDDVCAFNGSDATRKCLSGASTGGYWTLIGGGSGLKPASNDSYVQSNNTSGTAFYAPSGGIRTDSNLSRAFYAPNGGADIVGSVYLGAGENKVVRIGYNGDGEFWKLGVKGNTIQRGDLEVVGKIHASDDICTDKGGGKCLSTAGGSSSVPSTGVSSITAGSGIGVSGSTGNVTVSNIGVTSIGVDGSHITTNQSTGAVMITMTPTTLSCRSVMKSEIYTNNDTGSAYSLGAGAGCAADEYLTGGGGECLKSTMYRSSFDYNYPILGGTWVVQCRVPPAHSPECSLLGFLCDPPPQATARSFVVCCKTI